METRALKQAVRRNLDRFPDDFMFELAGDEITGLVSQNVIRGLGKLGGARPMAFTEQGVAMLSSVLRSPRAVQVNIAVMRAFVRLRELLLSNADLAGKLAALEAKYDSQFKAVHLHEWFLGSNVRTLRKSPNLPSAPECTTLLRLTLRAQSRSAASPGSRANDDGPDQGFVSPSR